MTFDDVVTKTAVTMAILIISAALAWMFVPDVALFPGTDPVRAGGVRRRSAGGRPA